MAILNMVWWWGGGWAKFATFPNLSNWLQAHWSGWSWYKSIDNIGCNVFWEVLFAIWWLWQSYRFDQWIRWIIYSPEKWAITFQTGMSSTAYISSYSVQIYADTTNHIYYPIINKSWTLYKCGSLAYDTFTYTAGTSQWAPSWSSLVSTTTTQSSDWVKWYLYKFWAYQQVHWIVVYLGWAWS